MSNIWVSSRLQLPCYRTHCRIYDKYLKFKDKTSMFNHYDAWLDDSTHIAIINEFIMQVLVNPVSRNSTYKNIHTKHFL